MARRRFSRKRHSPRSLNNKRKNTAQRSSRSRSGKQGRVEGVASRIEQDILLALYEHEEGLAGKELQRVLDLPRKFRKELQFLLQEMYHRKIIREVDGVFSLYSPSDFLEGKLSVHPKGFAFVAVDQVKNPRIKKDIFIPPGMLATATHGDLVLVRIVGKKDDRHEGRIVKIAKRGVTRLIGIHVAGGRGPGLVMPEDERFPFQLVIKKEQALGAKDGEAVWAEIISYREGQQNVEGKILEVLGDPNSIAVQNEMVVRKFDLPHTFSSKVEEQVKNFDDRVVLYKERTDLRQVLHVTIDGETARDFDDAVAIEKIKNGFRLYVSIADVSHYVKPNTPLDREAYKRGTSVYFPSRVLPMLPERLSNNLCSLVPNEDRYTFTAVMEFDSEGKRLSKRFMKTLIRSHHRLTYTIVKNILVDRDPETSAEYSDIVDNLGLMGDLALLLEKQRMQRGSIGFEIPEPWVILGKDETVDDIVRSERNQAHKLIEEFMLAANEAVAETFSEQRLDSLFRVHEKPDQLKVEEFAEFGSSMGLEIPAGEGSPHWFGKVLALTAGTPKEYIVSNLLLRTMQQARYAPENVGHFGLAAPFYTHFTSPIRRYPDLMVHRALAAMLTGKANKEEQAPANVSTGEAGLFLSKRERVAVDAEREMVERLQVRFMADKVGESFAAIVSGVTSFGLFVELVESFVSGAVPITALSNDYYEFHEKQHQLIGRGTGITFQLGDMLTVRLDSVEISRRRVNFSVVNTPERQEESGAE